ncbi:MAG TPA: SDR family oxidoreductase [Flavisolibacter sp.]|nr:SDR family oxidoreductase [Flavisolibacter sp.]
MQDINDKGVIPPHQSGISRKAENAVELPTEQAASQFYCKVKQRLLLVHLWKQLAGTLPVHFQLTDTNGHPVQGEAQKGLYLKIDIPGPGPGAGNKSDWVLIEEIVSSSESHRESTAFRVRPANNPMEGGSGVAHFYSRGASSHFTVSREGKIVSAAIYDRNLELNTEAEGADKLRNVAVGMAGMLIFSKLQWKSLTEGLVKESGGTFRDKVIVITGATGGVGRVTAWEFARQGAKVALLAREPVQLEATKKEVEALGGVALPISTDVASATAVDTAAEQIERALGPIDVWVNNAMNSVFAPVSDITPEEYKRVTEVTYLGVVYGTMSALKRMKRRDQGSIVLVGSALAYRGIPLQSAYCGAKHGIQGFYDSLRTELLHEKSKIKTCMVQLPAMNTTQFGWILSKLPNKPRPMGKIYAPEVAARAIVFAASHNRREILVGFPSYQAIIGNKIAPWYADHVLAENGYDGQQTDEPANPHRSNNLWEPVHEDRGAYGDFSAHATGKSLTLWASMNRNLVRAVAGLALLAMALAVRARVRE